MEDEVRAARPWCHPGFTVRLPCFFPRFFACKTDLVMAWTGALDQRGGGGQVGLDTQVQLRESIHFHPPPDARAVQDHRAGTYVNNTTLLECLPLQLALRMRGAVPSDHAEPLTRGLHIRSAQVLSLIHI